MQRNAPLAKRVQSKAIVPLVIHNTDTRHHSTLSPCCCPFNIGKCAGGVCATKNNGEPCVQSSDCMTHITISTQDQPYDHHTAISYRCVLFAITGLSGICDTSSTNTCVGRTVGTTCANNTECASTWCDTTTTLKCVATSCATGVKDGLETDIDCGVYATYMHACPCLEMSVR